MGEGGVNEQMTERFWWTYSSKVRLRFQDWHSIHTNSLLVTIAYHTPESNVNGMLVMVLYHQRASGRKDKHLTIMNIFILAREIRWPKVFDHVRRGGQANQPPSIP